MVERFAAVVAAVVGLAVAATAEGAMARAGMGHRVLYRVMGRAGAVELAAGFPSQFVYAFVWRLVAAAAALARLALPA